ncbi:beta-ketoacyl synthase N-terminal-like domain-containing protein [Streptomyces thermocarboxydus]
MVGVGCRFPGGADSPAAYWRLLTDGRDAVGTVPGDAGSGSCRTVPSCPPTSAGTAASWTASRSSTPSSSASPPTRPWPSTRSSGCCSK